VSRGACNCYYQNLEETKSRSSSAVGKVTPLVKELPLIALSVLSIGIWAPILIVITSLAVALVLTRP
jgi:hypothetical protein